MAATAALSSKYQISIPTLHRQYKLAAAGTIVHATARFHGAGLLACGTHFSGLPGGVPYPGTTEP